MLLLHSRSQLLSHRLFTLSTAHHPSQSTRVSPPPHIHGEVSTVPPIPHIPPPTQPIPVYVPSTVHVEVGSTAPHPSQQTPVSPPPHVHVEVSMVPLFLISLLLHCRSQYMSRRIFTLRLAVLLQNLPLYHTILSPLVSTLSLEALLLVLLSLSPSQFWVLLNEIHNKTIQNGGEWIV